MKRKYFTFKPFIDVLFCCLLMLVAILFLLKTEEDAQKMRPPNVIFEVILTWEGENPDDLDLYVKAASGHVVSFNNREGGPGSLIALDHDALGIRNNFIPENQKGTLAKFHEERVSFRGVTEGENIVTVHCYAKRSTEPVKCKVTLIKIKPYKQIIVEELELKVTGDEITAFRFDTDSGGNVTGINKLEAKLVTLGQLEE
ncbi:hypothetical protein H8E06_00205 [bacterium]|nr:hypothetical protein [bacterium]